MAVTLAGVTFQNPLPVIARVTSMLGDPRDYGPHEGYDLAAAGGTNILAAAAGRVTQSGYMEGGYGYYVEIEHAPGLRTLYGHMKEAPLVEVDEQVGQGAVIGHVGSTGYSDGNHLHFHIKYNTVYQDVAQFVDLGIKGASRAVGAVVDTLPDPVKAWLQDCTAVLLEEGADAYKECMGSHEAEAMEYVDPDVWDNLVEQGPTLAGGSTKPDSDCQYSVGSLFPGTGDICLDSIVVPVRTGTMNVLFFPARTLINAFSLSDAPLADGEATYEWLTQPENSTMFVVSLVILLLVVVLIVVAAKQFLTDSAVQVVTGALDNPATSAVELVS